MEDREKQILAITQDLSDCLQYDIEDSSMVDTYDTACSLVDKGWVKIHEDSVVISRKELKEKYVPKNFYELTKKVHKEKVEELENLIGYWKEAHKEMAEKIINWIDTYYPCYSRADLIKELSKQFGVEVKE